MKPVALRSLALTLATAVFGVGSGSAASVPGGVSTNWSGYAAMAARFASVTASWVEPVADCSVYPPIPTAASFWVGLGGNEAVNAGKVEQIGTEF